MKRYIASRQRRMEWWVWDLKFNLRVPGGLYMGAGSRQLAEAHAARLNSGEAA